MNYYQILQQLPAACKKTELIITEGDNAGSKALIAGGGIAACTGPESARTFFEKVIAEHDSKDANEPDSLDLRGIGEFVFADRSLFYEQLEKKPRLVICGAGHVGLAICRIAAMTGLETVVIDDRPEFTLQAKESGAAQVICAPFAEALEGIGSDTRTCFVLVTRGHAHGMECLRMILRKPHLYLGMMSSKKRAAAARETLLQEGFTPGEVRSVYMPVGLKIGAETPGEIAVSVMAQIISVIRMEGAGDGYQPEILKLLTEGKAPADPVMEGITIEGKAPADPAMEGIAAEGKETADGINRQAQEPAFAVLATIVKKSGEAPREPGTRMAVLKDGRICGSIGGGYAEAEIVKAAKQMLQEDSAGSSAFVKVEMPLVKSGTEDFAPAGLSEKSSVVTEESMICGGKITVLLEKI